MSGTSKDLSTATPDLPLAQSAPHRALWGLFDRKERWSLSWRGWLAFAFALFVVGALVLKGIYPFLAITHRVNVDVLVVEAGFTITLFRKRGRVPIWFLSARLCDGRTGRGNWRIHQ